MEVGLGDGRPAAVGQGGEGGLDRPVAAVRPARQVQGVEPGEAAHDAAQQRCQLMGLITGVGHITYEDLRAWRMAAWRAALRHMIRACVAEHRLLQGTVVTTISFADIVGMIRFSWPRLCEWASRTFGVRALTAALVQRQQARSAARSPHERLSTTTSSTASGRPSNRMGSSFAWYRRCVITGSTPKRRQVLLTRHYMWQANFMRIRVGTEGQEGGRDGCHCACSCSDPALLRSTRAWPLSSFFTPWMNDVLRECSAVPQCAGGLAQLGATAP